MEDRRKNCADHEVFDNAVASRGTVALAVGGPTLTVSRLAVFRLADRGDYPPPGKLNRIECAEGHDLKFLPGTERRKLAAVLQRQEVWQRIEEPVVRRSSNLTLSAGTTGIGAGTGSARIGLPLCWRTRCRCVLRRALLSGIFFGRVLLSRALSVSNRSLRSGIGVGRRRSLLRRGRNSDKT